MTFLAKLQVKVQEFKVQQGQITIFTLMIFMMVVSVLLGQYGSALGYACQADGKCAARLSLESFLAAYQRPLRDRYHILSVDGGYGTEKFQQEYIEQHIQKLCDENIKSTLTKKLVQSMDMNNLTFIMLDDGDWSFMLREIQLYAKNDGVIQEIQSFIHQWNSNNKAASSTLQRKQQEVIPDAQDGNGEIQQVRDPRDQLMSIWNKGILNAALPEGYPVSEKEVEMSDVSFPEMGERSGMGMNFKDDHGILSVFQQWQSMFDLNEVGHTIVRESSVLWYIQDVFQNAVEIEENEDSVLNYEMEYLISGNVKDSENLKNVLWKLLALRCVMNLSYILSSPSMTVQVEETAAVISTGLLIPQFTEVVAFLLKMSWAFSEALSDTRALLQGRKIPFLKSQTSWHLSWKDLMDLSSSILDGGGCDQGLGYEDYLNVLLVLTGRDRKYRRMTHLMEKNIRLLPEYGHFSMKNCIYGVEAEFCLDLGKYKKYSIKSALSY